MNEFEVNAVSKPHRQSPHEHITHIGNNDDGWCMTREEAIRRIEARPQTEAFFTVDKSTGKKVYIGVVRQTGKAPHLRTHADGKWSDNLLALPECNASAKLVA
jgi:hypothetical protein